MQIIDHARNEKEAEEKLRLFWEENPDFKGSYVVVLDLDDIEKYQEEQKTTKAHTRPIAPGKPPIIEHTKKKDKNMTNNLSFEEMMTLVFGEEKLKEMKKIAERKAAIAQEKWKKEIKEIMDNISENDDIIDNEEVAMKHKVLMDTVAFDRKPTDREIGAIQNRLPELAVEMTIEDIAAALVSGRTFKPNYMTGKSQDSFVSSTLIAVDIDNKGKELEECGYVSIDKFLEESSRSELRPAVVYTTFSHTDVCHKYRALFQIDRVITNLNELKAIGRALKAEYPYADAKVSVVHPIYGGRELIKLDATAVINPVVSYEDLKPTVKGKETTITNVVAEKKILTKELLISNLQSIKDQFKGTTIDAVNSFEWINENIPMTVALGYDTDTRFRCILPGHKDSKPSARISETTEGRQNYICSCQDTYTSLIDIVAQALNMNKVLVQYVIADALGITIGSDYQRKMRLLIADIMANTDRIIEEDSVLYKFMTRSNLHGLYNLIQQFASKHITVQPLGAADKITFFMAQSQIQKQMVKFNMKGSSMIGYKLNTLKELGLIRALRDDEINPEALEAAKNIQKTMAVINQTKYMNRIEYYELCLVTPEQIKQAEEIIIALKESGVKRRHNNAARRAAALGKDFAAKVNVQTNVIEKVTDPKVLKKRDKMVAAAQSLISKQGYFTEDQLRQAYDSKRKQKKYEVQKLIDDTIPYIINNLGIKKDRVKNSTREDYSIPGKIKNNTTIYHF